VRSDRNNIRFPPKGWLLATLSILFCLGAAGCGPTPTSVILITADTLRADHLHCYGYFRSTSPNIDSLAREGVLFENALTPITTTLPAHVSLMTGTTPLVHGIKGNFQLFDIPLETSEGLKTAAQMFQEMGYTTAAFVSAAPVKKATGIATGFDTFDEPEGRERTAAEVNERVFAWLDSAPREPFFLWIHYFDPHWPYKAPPDFKGKFRRNKKLDAYLKENKFPEPIPPPTYMMHNSYDREIKYLDSELGRLMEKFRSMGWYDETALVFTSDHGEGLGQHMWREHGRIYNEQLFVPLIIKFPASMGMKGQRRENMTALIDVVPTLVETLELPVPAQVRDQFEGRNALNDEMARDFVFSERTPRERNWESGEKYSLTGKKWKYFLLTDGADELYCMEKDRAETVNVIDQFPEIADHMEREIRAILKDAESRTDGLRKKGAIRAEFEEQLRGLGYSK